jgi:hypothetical protein
MLGSAGAHSATNPRGWFGNDPSADVTTPAGVTAFDRRMLAYADTTIAVLKRANAQGLIVWDVEGQETPVSSYTGDPRYLPKEMDAIADQFFKKFTDAGLRVGVCVRPQRPVKTIYGDSYDQMEVADMAYNIKDKIAYAKRRWGCTLFYVDSDARHDDSMSWSVESAYTLDPASVFQDAAAANPDCLIIPEQKITRHFAYGAPYIELRQAVASTDPMALRVYPNAFSVINVSMDNPGGPLDARRGELISSVKRGDVLMFQCWYTASEFQPMLDIYKAAGR